MPSLVSQNEVLKLNQELGVHDDRLSFLADLHADDLADLRRLISHTLFARHESRFHTLASLSRAMPTQITQKVAEYALGPMLSARVANVIDPGLAIKVAQGLSPDFLTQVTRSLDPAKSARIISGLQPEVIIDVGCRLLKDAEYLTLGRFVSVVDPALALSVVEEATPDQILQTSLLTEDRAALDAIVRLMPDDRVADVIMMATESEYFDDAFAVLAVLSQESKNRVIRFALDQPVERINLLVEAVRRNDAWADILPSVTEIPEDLVRRVINIAATLDPQLLSVIITKARDLELGPALVPLVMRMDDEHLALLQRVPELREPAFQDWIVESSGISERIVRAVFVELNLA